MMRRIPQAARRPATSCAWRSPSSVSCGSTMPGSTRVRAKCAAGAAVVAGEAVALTCLVLEADRQSQSLGDDLRGVQGAPVGAGDDAADPASGEAPGHLVRLALALLGELRIDDAGVDAGAGEVHVEVRLPVADQDHRSVRGPSRRLSARLSS